MKYLNRLFLKKYLRHLEGQIKRDCFDRNLSRRIDAVRFLLEAEQ